MKKEVFFRVDGNEKIGLGHLFRCMAIAEMLKSDFQSTFLIQSPDESTIHQLEDYHRKVVPLSRENDSQKEAYSLIKNHIPENSIVVLDGYHFTEEYQNILLGKSIKLVCIDDIHSICFFSHVIINHASGVKPSDYLAQSYTRYYLGTDYALLRPPFLKAAEQISLVRQIESVFINMGGADPDNYTLKALQYCQELKDIKKIEIVVGAAYRFYTQLESYAKKSKTKVIIHQNIGADLMCGIMKNTQIAICSASGVAYEYCSVKGFLFLLKTASNQADLYSFLIEKRLAFPLERIGELYHSHDTHSEVIKNQQLYFGGKSGKRILNIFLNLSIEEKIHLRKAGPDDLLRYFYWANDPVVRMNSINKEIIRLEDHEKWFKAKLTDRNSNLYLFSIEEEFIGQVRLDKKEGAWIIGFSVDEKFRGRGFGEIIVQMAMFELKKTLNEPVIYKAQVQLNNQPSENIFHRLGFSSERQELINNEVYHNFIKVLS